MARWRIGQRVWDEERVPKQEVPNSGTRSMTLWKTIHPEPGDFLILKSSSLRPFLPGRVGRAKRKLSVERNLYRRATASYHRSNFLAIDICLFQKQDTSDVAPHLKIRSGDYLDSAYQKQGVRDPYFNCLCTVLWRWNLDAECTKGHLKSVLNNYL